MESIYRLFCFFSFIFLIQISNLHAQMNVPVNIISSGGGQIQSENYRIASTIGQSTIGTIQSPDFQKNMGFWYQASSSAWEPTSIEDLEEMPNEFVLEQNYPNPFNPSTQIRFAIPEQAHVRLVIYNLLGQHVTTLVNENRSPGWYEVSFDASGLSSGMYIYRIEAGSYVETRQMLLVN